MTKESIIEEILDETLDIIRLPRRERIAKYIELYELKTQISNITPLPRSQGIGNYVSLSEQRRDEATGKR